MVQQDLIGFYNSVPHARIQQALELLTWRLEELFQQKVEDIVFQVDMRAGTKGLRIFRGQQRFRQSVTRVLRLCHVQELTTFLLRSAYFKVGQDTFRQIQGITIGSSSLLFGGRRTGISVDSQFSTATSGGRFTSSIQIC